MVRTGQSRAITRSRVTRSPEETKARIVAAAQAVFATHGYAGGVVRQIAKMAHVAPSLVMHYFGTKEALFEAAFIQSLDLTPMLVVDRDQFGQRAVDLLSSPESSAVLTSSLLAHSIGDPQTREIAVRLMESVVLERTTEFLEGDRAYPRAQLTAMLALGYAMLRILVPLGHDGTDDDKLVENWMSRQLQRLAEEG